MNINDIAEQLFSYDWPKNEELVQFAEAGHGFGGDDGYYGVIYFSDLDEYDRKEGKSFIPEGFVEIYYWDGEVKEIQIKEKEYLSLLKKHLEKEEEKVLITRVINLKMTIESRELPDPK